MFACRSPFFASPPRRATCAVAAVLAAAMLWCAPVAAQPADTAQTGSAQANTARVGDDRGLALGYQELKREYRAYQRAPSDAAAPDTADQRAAQGGIEIDGLVVDETQTKIGRDFYDVFYSRWSAPEGAVNFTVTVKEQILPNRGTRVVVQLNDEVAFRTYLKPRYEEIERAARGAVYYVKRKLRDDAPSRLIY